MIPVEGPNIHGERDAHELLDVAVLLQGDDSLIVLNVVNVGHFLELFFLL